MAPETFPPRKTELSPQSFTAVVEKLGEHVEYAASQNVATSISIQNGFHYKKKFGEHEVVNLGEQQETFAASHAKLAVVAFKLAKGLDGKDDLRDIVSMLQISDNGAFIRQKRHIAPEVVTFAKEQIGIDTDILTIRDNGSSYAGNTTALDSLKLFLSTLRIAHKDSHISNDIHRALSENTSKYGVRARFTPSVGLHLMNKTGDYFGQDDPEINEAVHHDVGILYTTGKHKQRLAYSITSSASSRLGAFNADRLNQIVAVTLIEALGGTPKSALKSAIGSVATKLLSKR